MSDIFDKFKDSTEVNFYARCIEICYSRKGFGFGTVIIHYDSAEKKWKIDNEHVGKEFVTKLLQEAAPLIVEQLFKESNYV